jgi:uncharacterized protein (TIGR01777 family)
MKVLITGATGLIGKAITDLCLQENIEVNYLTTSFTKIENDPHYKGFYWNPSEGDIDINCLLEVDVIIHLAGATIAKRWTPTYKTEIIESRVLSGNLLFNTLQKNEHKVKHFITASGVDIYPDSLDKTYDETEKETNDTFLGNVVLRWEEVADKFSLANLKVTKIRTGMVLDQAEGALTQISKPIKLGFGAALGSGKQWQSWIHIEDIAALYLFVIKNTLDGIYNGVSPNPVTNTELTKAIAKQLKKPLWLPNAPGFILKTILGDMSALLLGSKKASSKKIQQAGFQFKYPDLDSALKDLK